MGVSTERFLDRGFRFQWPSFIPNSNGEFGVLQSVINPKSF